MSSRLISIAAQLSIVGTQQSPPAYLEEEVLAPDPMNMTQYRAVAPSARGSALVALLNTTAKPETLGVTCLSKNGAAARHNYSLSAFRSMILPVCGDALSGGDPAAAMETLATKDDAGAEHGATGIDVASDTGMRTFAVWGIAPKLSEDSLTPISMNFTYSAQIKSASMVFAGVPVGIADLLGSENFTPELAVANFALLPSNVTISYSRMSANNPESKPVASFSLAAGAVQEFNLPDLAGDPGMRNSFVVTSDAQPGAVIGNLISISEQLTVTDTNANGTASPSSGATNSSYQLIAFYSSGRLGASLPSNAYTYILQTITYPPTGKTVRVNCIGNLATTVTVTNYTATPTLACNHTAH